MWSDMCERVRVDLARHSGDAAQVAGDLPQFSAAVFAAPLVGQLTGPGRRSGHACGSWRDKLFLQDSDRFALIVAMPESYLTEQMALACCLDGTGGNSGDTAIYVGVLSVSPVVATMPPGRSRADLNIVCALSAAAKSKTGVRGLRFVEPHVGVKGNDEVGKGANWKPPRKQEDVTRELALT